MDELSAYLLNGKGHAKLSAETLELMGKQAANQYLEDGIALNDAITKIAGAYNDISTEQVKRIVEFANQSVYLAKHDQAKTANAESSYPQFELADASKILQDLSEDARPTISPQTDIDYSRSSNKTKISSAITEKALEELFKTASEDDKEYSTETIASDVLEMKHSLIGLIDNLNDRYNQHESLFKEATAEFYSNVKSHILEGGELGEVYTAAQSVCPDRDKLDDLMEPIVRGLLVEKVAKAEALATHMSELHKFAHRVVNPEHPFVTTFSAMLLAGDELIKVSSALSEANEGLTKVKEFIHKAYFTKEAMSSMMSSMPKSVNQAGSSMKGITPASSTGIKTLAQKIPAPVPPTTFGSGS